MRPEKKSQNLLKETQARAKMLEYSVPADKQPSSQNPLRLFTLTIGLLGDLAASINRGQSTSESFLDLKHNLLFAARFFDSYTQSNWDEALESYFSLMGAASYYLCDLPGSAAVLANNIKNEFIDLEADGLENLLFWLLQTNLTHIPQCDGPFSNDIKKISKYFLQFFKEGKGEEALLSCTKELRKIIYETGTPKHLLFCDIILAIIIKKLKILLGRFSLYIQTSHMKHGSIHYKRKALLRNFGRHNIFWESLTFSKGNLQLFKCQLVLEKQKQ